MKNLLLYNYNIDVDDLIVQNDYISSFYVDYQKYYLIKTTRVKKDIEELASYLSQTINSFHFILKNRFGNVITEDDNKQYVLLKINGPENNEIDMKDIVTEPILFDSSSSLLNRNDWSKLWSEKVDYLEYQVSELGKEHPIILKSFSYYVGLAENAIEYYNLLNTKDVPLYLSHRRIKYPNISVNYYNPLNLVVDYRVRDISGYIKAKFFSGGYVIDDIKWLIDKNILSPIEYNLLYARLLYPSYYFDALSRVIEHGDNEDDLLIYISRVNDYELLLKKVYELLSSKCNMVKIDWIIKKES